MVTEVLAGQQLKKLGLELIFRVGLEISLKININSKQTNLFPGGRGPSPPHPPALTSDNSDITSGPWRLVASVLILSEQLRQLGLEISLKITINSKQTHIFPGGPGG